MDSQLSGNAIGPAAPRPCPCPCPRFCCPRLCVVGHTVPSPCEGRASNYSACPEVESTSSRGSSTADVPSAGSGPRWSTAEERMHFPPASAPTAGAYAVRLPTPPCLAVMLHIWDQVQPSGCLSGPSQILQRVDQPSHGSTSTRISSLLGTLHRKQREHGQGSTATGPSILHVRAPSRHQATKLLNSGLRTTGWSSIAQRPQSPTGQPPLAHRPCCPHRHRPGPLPLRRRRPRPWRPAQRRRRHRALTLGATGGWRRGALRCRRRQRTLRTSAPRHEGGNSAACWRGRRCGSLHFHYDMQVGITVYEG